MAFFHDHVPNDAGSLNSLFIVSMIAALLGFAVVEAFLFG